MVEDQEFHVGLDGQLEGLLTGRVGRLVAVVARKKGRIVDEDLRVHDDCGIQGEGVAAVREEGLLVLGHDMLTAVFEHQVANLLLSEAGELLAQLRALLDDRVPERAGGASMPGAK